MTSEMQSKYNIKKVESKWYPWWEKNGYFHQEVDENKESFCIVMPPPNVTGRLHLGHAIDNTLQDILIRFKRMKGYNTLWIPGTDHAGIATQAIVEEKLKKTEGLTRQDLGREAFLEKVWNWKELYHKRITNQLRLLGSSCDWKRERFTLDDDCSDAVKEVFIYLYKKGLIYKGNHIINWCPSCLTTISDIEVEHKDDESSLWYIRYLVDGTSDYITIATTRPETMLGDTAIAVAPDDGRYQDYIGKFAILPLINRKIPIISDDYVNKSFGTGAVKITPSHDPNDFEIANRHNLPQIIVIDQEGNMTGDIGKYFGMNRDLCRVVIVEDLKKAGFLVSTEPYTHAIGKCYRCGTIIEPLVSSQWFVKMNSLAKRALEEVKKREAKFIPERFIKVYTIWLEKIKDWCISRQLWWGHRIPVWYCEDCGEVMCSKEFLKKCTKCNSTNIYQDPDVLDTWFSSALWPLSVLGWPKKTKELEQFYPISVLVTGRDIIFFWVARMLFMGLELMDKVPFKEIFIHGLILDSKGRKMSKSLNNGIDPIEIIENYGADTLRFMLVTGNTPGNDIRFQKDRLEGARNFCNKIWNASRFLIMNLEGYNAETPDKSLFTLADKWILTEYNKTIKKVTRNFDEYELGEGADAIYDFICNSFCDWYIEIVKSRLYNGIAEEKIVVKWILSKILIDSMKLLHPFMPFITEEIWQYLPHKGETIMLDSWPVANNEECFITEKNQMENIMEIIRLVRSIRVEMNVPFCKKVPISLFVKNENEKLAKLAIPYLETMANSKIVTIGFKGDNKPTKSAIGVTKKFEVYLPLEHLIDISTEKKRLEKELAHLEKEVQRIEKKLSSEGFVKKAPTKIIKDEKEKLAGYKEQYNAVKERWGAL